MRFKSSISIAFPLFFVCLLACKSGDNPVDSSSMVYRFSGRVLDLTGHPLEGIGVHYVPHLVAGSVSGVLAVSLPIVVIGFDLDTSAHVRVIMFRYGTNDTVALIVDDYFIAGGNEVEVDVSRWTNGVYYYRIIVDGKLREDRKLLLLKSVEPDSLVSADPIRLTDRRGNFGMPISVFGVGLRFQEFIPPESNRTEVITSELDLVLTRPGRRAFVQRVVIDTSSSMEMTFRLDP